MPFLKQGWFLYFKSAHCSTAYSPASKFMKQVYDPLAYMWFDFTLWQGRWGNQNKSNALSAFYISVWWIFWSTSYGTDAKQ